MTRRIITAILLVVWLSLLGAGVSSYFITRAILIANLDETIYSRISSLPELERPALVPDVEHARTSPSDVSDRYVIQFPTTAPGGARRVASPTVSPSAVPAVRIISASFSRLAGGTPLRTVVAQAYARRNSPADPLSQVTVIYSAPADDIDESLSTLLYCFGGLGVVAAIGSILAARAAAKAALAPLHDASNTIGAIDERSLDRRISVEKLPAEFAPAAVRLNEMLARLEIAFAQRRQFLADASHELRTPVAALVTTLEVALRRQRSPEEYARSLDRCLADAKLLHQLVSALIEQARAERFAPQPDFVPVSISLLLRQCIHTVSPLADEKGLILATDIPENLAVITDENRIRSAVGNLLANAVEYTPADSTDSPQGRILLSAELLPPAPSAPTNSSDPPAALQAAIPDGIPTRTKRLCIHVQDNGPGIPAQHLPHIFEPFYRADASRPLASHLGLGLALVRSSLRALGGDCTVQSPPPGQAKGSLFTLELPTVELTSESALAQTPTRSPAPLALPIKQEVS